MAPFISAEVRRAVFDLHPSKDQGPDGFTSLFFQNSWPFLGDDITEAALKILNDNGDIKGWNATIITIIPKVKEPQFPKDFRPISLCNACYKIIAKTVSNRFRPILSQVIDQSQSAFVPGKDFNSHSSMIAFSRRLIVGLQSFSRQGANKFSLSYFCKPFRHMLCRVSKFLFSFARTLNSCVLNFGGVLMLIAKVYIVLLGHLYANQSRSGEWGFGV